MTEQTKYFIARAIGYGLISFSLVPGYKAYLLYTGLCMVDIWRKPA